MGRNNFFEVIIGIEFFGIPYFSTKIYVDIWIPEFWFADIFNFSPIKRIVRLDGMVHEIHLFLVSYYICYIGPHDMAF